MTNHGDGTAYAIKLTGDDCKPFVWVGDAAKVDQINKDAEAKISIAEPLWSDTLSELTPGESVTVIVMISTDPKRKAVGIRASWPRFPGRPFGQRHSEYTFDKGRFVEWGWPGE